MKQIKKLSLSNVISKLSRNEMRYVMAGSGWYDPYGGMICYADFQCQEHYNWSVRVSCFNGHCRIG